MSKNTKKETDLQDFTFDSPTTFFGQKVEGLDLGEEVVDGDGKLENFEDEPEVLSPETFGQNLSPEEVTKPTKKAAKAAPSKKEGAVIDENEEEDEKDEEDDEPEVTKASGKKKEEVDPEGDEHTSDTKKESKKETQKATEKDKVEESSDEEIFTELSKEFKDKKFFANVEVPEKVTEEEFFELIEKEFEAREDESLEAFIEELEADEDAADFIRYKKKGGKTADFLNVYATGLDLSTFDDSDDKQVESIIRYYSANVLGLDAEDTEDKIATLKEKGKDKTTAASWFAKLKEADAKLKQKLIKDQEEAYNKKKASAKAFKEDFEKTLKAVDEIGLFTISKEDKKKLASFLTDPTEKVGKDKYVPQFHLALNKVLNPKTEQDKKNLILLTKLLFNNFEVKDDVIKKAKTEVVTKTKSRLAELKRGGKVAASSGGASATGSALADAFS